MSEAVKINIEKYGFFFWFILIGFVEVIVATIEKAEYIFLGIYFIGIGLLGYVISEITDRLWEQETQSAGKSWWIFIYKFLLGAALILLINRKIPLF